MEEPLRLRVFFDDRKMLNKSQRSEGLKHCWLLLNPSIATISDLESHVRKTFHLKRSCPNGIVLYMDDFVLPPFESTCVLRDKDIIRVRKKDATGVDAIVLGDDPPYIPDSGVPDTKHIIDSEKLLAITEFGEDSDQHKKKIDKDICVHEEKAIHMESPSKLKNKRKHSDGILLPKTKKLKTPSMKPDITGEGIKNIQNAYEVVNNVLGKSLGSSQKRGRSGGNSSKNEKASTVDGSHSISVQLENKIEQVTGFVRRGKRNAQVEEKIGGNTCEPHVHGSVTKVQGRNARRKKKKREWVREMKPLWRKNTLNHSLPTAIHKESSEKQETEQNTEMEKEIVPVVIRPGHIRFRPLDEEQSPWQSQEAMETLQLKGTGSNNKEKWHSANSVSKWNDSNGYKEQFNGNGNGNIASKWNNANGNRGPKCFRENPGSKCNDANGYKGQEWVREKTGSKWNDANGYKGQKWARENDGRKWNDANGFKEHSANGYKEQSNGKQKTMITWNDANGYKEQCNPRVPGWRNANDYEGQKWVGDNTGCKWNITNGYNEQSVGKEKTMSTWNNASYYKVQGYTKVDNRGDANGYKGQKWVRENVGSKSNGGDANGYRGQKLVRENMQSKWNVANGYKEQSNGNEIMAKRWTDANGFGDQCISKATDKWDPANVHKEPNNSVSVTLKAKSGSSPFESLFPLTRIPQVGDVLAYRLIELSPSWCPEVSSFRVGEVTSYNYLSMSIILVPVPEFPIFSDEDVERGDPMHKRKPSPYNDDGSLQIHYPSLVDVRLLKASDSGPTSSDSFEREMDTQAAAPVNKWELAIANANVKGTVSQPKENGIASSSTWDKLKHTLNEKKVQLQQKDGWDEWTPSKRNVGTSWSHQAMRGRAMGPNLAIIRGRNNRYQYSK